MLAAAFFSAFVFAVVVGVIALTAVIAFKVAAHLIFLPFKLLLLPLLAVVVLVKFAIVLAVGAIFVALLVPLAIIFCLVAAPIAIAHAIF